MEDKKISINSIDAYIATFPETVQGILKEIRAIINDSVPDVQESISYQMPTFKLNGKRLIYFAAFKKHIGLFGASGVIEAFPEELTAYAGPKGNLQFPLNQPMPYDLICKIVAFRVSKIL
mgnify:FL=1